MFVSLSLSTPQHIFLTKLRTKFRAFVGGFGSGKTTVGCTKLLLFAGANPGYRQGYFAPTYRDIRDVFYPTIDDVAERLGYRIKIRKGDREVDIYRGRAYYGTIIGRSMEDPAGIVGFEIAEAQVDEIDILPKAKAKLAWNKILGRLRQVVPGHVNGIGVTTTPEGFRFVYDTFAHPTASYSMVQASTLENHQNLPEDYISSLRETYSAELIKAYLDGVFVNLTTGSVYRSFDRTKNGSDEVARADEPIFVGMDFNVGKMAACVNVRRGQDFHCVDEISKGIDTPAVIGTLKDRYPKRRITVYPDASGRSGSSRGASESDVGLLEQAGFNVLVEKQNPRVKDRVQAVNKAFEDGRWFINTKRAPETTKCLEQQAYDDSGEPDKKSGLDHHPDALGYIVAYERPIVKPTHTSRSLRI